MNKLKVVVIGAGPAGMSAAVAAAQQGARVYLMEKGPKPGRKLNITGKGRCNITNTAELNDFIKAFAPNGVFLYSAFSRYFRNELLADLKAMGIETQIERGGRVFPVSNNAEDVTNAYINKLNRLNVELHLNTRIQHIVVEQGCVQGVTLKKKTLFADAVIIAGGGASYPGTGSNGDSFKLAEALGHTIVTPRPALSALVVKEPWVKSLQGLSLKNVSAKIAYTEAELLRKPVASEFGEMLFTHDGVSGPIILTLSRTAGKMLGKGQVLLSIDLKPALDEEQLKARFIREFVKPIYFKNYLPELLPKSLQPVFIRCVDIPANKTLNKITSDERGRLIALLKNFRLTITGMADLASAIVTAGGISLKEINPKTMESKLVSGLYCVGEALDLDAETGGYNLQAAFSTGWIAGMSAAENRTCRNSQYDE